MFTLDSMLSRVINSVGGECPWATSARGSSNYFSVTVQREGDLCGGPLCNVDDNHQELFSQAIQYSTPLGFFLFKKVPMSVLLNSKLP